MSVFSRLRRVKQGRRQAEAAAMRAEHEDDIIARTPLVWGDLPNGTHKGCGGSVERSSLGAGYTSQFCRTCQRFLPVEEIV